MTEPTLSTHSSPINTPPVLAPKASNKGLWFLVFILVLAVIGLGGAVWYLFQQQNQAGRALAKQFSLVDKQVSTSVVLSKQAVSVADNLQERLTGLELKNQEMLSQQGALQDLYQRLSQADDQRSLSEIEQILRIATQQLNLAGDVTGAIAALELAKYRLEDTKRPDFRLAIQAIDGDLARLRAAPSFDMVTMTRKVDDLITQIDRLPLVVDSVPSFPTETKPSSAQSAQAVTSKPTREASTWSDYWTQVSDWVATAFDKVKDETKAIVVVQKIGTPDAMLLSPQQGYQLRENIKLRLLNARLSLLSRQPQLWVDDLTAVETSLTQYFDTNHPATKQSLEALTNLKQIELGAEIPQITESVAAVHALAVSKISATQP